MDSFARKETKSHLIESPFATMISSQLPLNQSKKLKILHIITDLFVGGAEMMLLKLLSHWQGNEFENSVISLRGEGEVGKRIQNLGIPVTNLGMRAAVPSISGTLKLVKIIKNFSPDIIQGWMYHGNLAATLGSNLAGFKSSVLWNVRQSLYGFEKERLLSRVVIKLGAKLSKKTQRIIYNSNVSRSQHEEFGFSSNRGVFIPNGFDLEKFRPDSSAKQNLKEKLKIPLESPVIGLIARYHPMKGHEDFLAAAQILTASHPGAHFVLAGTRVDEENKKLTGKVQELGLKGRVHLLGERRDTPLITAGLDIAASCSFTIEGFSNAIGEAMACGVPVVATEVGDAAYLVGDSGKIIVPQRPDLMANAWKDLLQKDGDYREALGRKGRARIEQNFGINAISEQYKNLYYSVLEKCAVS